MAERVDIGDGLGLGFEVLVSKGRGIGRLALFLAGGFLRDLGLGLHGLFDHVGRVVGADRLRGHFAVVVGPGVLGLAVGMAQSRHGSGLGLGLEGFVFEGRGIGRLTCFLAGGCLDGLDRGLYGLFHDVGRIILADHLRGHFAVVVRPLVSRRAVLMADRVNVGNGLGLGFEVLVGEGRGVCRLALVFAGGFLRDFAGRLHGLFDHVSRVVCADRLRGHFAVVVGPGVLRLAVGVAERVDIGDGLGLGFEVLVSKGRGIGRLALFLAGGFLRDLGLGLHGLFDHVGRVVGADRLRGHFAVVVGPGVLGLAVGMAQSRHGSGLGLGLEGFVFEGRGVGRLARFLAGGFLSGLDRGLYGFFDHVGRIVLADHLRGHFAVVVRPGVLGRTVLVADRVNVGNGLGLGLKESVGEGRSEGRLALFLAGGLLRDFTGRLHGLFDHVSRVVRADRLRGHFAVIVRPGVLGRTVLMADRIDRSGLGLRFKSFVFEGSGIGRLTRFLAGGFLRDFFAGLRGLFDHMARVVCADGSGRHAAVVFRPLIGRIAIGMAESRNFRRLGLGGESRIGEGRGVGRLARSFAGGFLRGGDRRLHGLGIDVSGILGADAAGRHAAVVFRPFVARLAVLVRIQRHAGRLSDQVFKDAGEIGVLYIHDLNGIVVVADVGEVDRQENGAGRNGNAGRTGGVGVNAFRADKKTEPSIGNVGFVIVLGRHINTLGAVNVKLDAGKSFQFFIGNDVQADLSVLDHRAEGESAILGRCHADAGEEAENHRKRQSE